MKCIDEHQRIANLHRVNPHCVLEPMPGIVHFSQSAAVETAVVYSQRRLAHSRAEEEGQARAEARGELMVPEVLRQRPTRT